jgi:membrane protein DedA with SNARE-associated domain
MIATLIRYGIGLVFLNVLVEQLGIPLPSLPTLIVAGALAAEGKLSLALVIAASFSAALVADTIWFVLGRRFGQRILKGLCRVSLSPDACVRQTQGLFERFGMGTVVASKFIVGFSTVAPPLAGAMGVRTLRFLAYDLLGITLWAGSAIALGYVFHDAVGDVIATLSNYGEVALLFVAAAFALFIALKWVQRRRFFLALRMARIEPEELHDLMETEPRPIVVDVRTDSGRRVDPRRIPGATVLEIHLIDEKAAGLPRDKDIVVYCT